MPLNPITVLAHRGRAIRDLRSSTTMLTPNGKSPSLNHRASAQWCQLPSTFSAAPATLEDAHPQPSSCAGALRAVHKPNTPTRSSPTWRGGVRPLLSSLIIPHLAHKSSPGAALQVGTMPVAPWSLLACPAEVDCPPHKSLTHGCRSNNALVLLSSSSAQQHNG
jgi:hypothetical protein